MDEDLVTYKAVGVKSWQPPWLLHKYAQCDFVLVNNKWKNAVTDVSTTQVHAVDTDHKLVIASVHFKLKYQIHSTPASCIRLRNPNAQQLGDYNKQVSETAMLADMAGINGPPDMDALSKKILESAQAHLPKLDPK